MGDDMTMIWQWFDNDLTMIWQWSDNVHTSACLWSTLSATKKQKTCLQDVIEIQKIEIQEHYWRNVDRCIVVIHVTYFKLLTTSLCRYYNENVLAASASKLLENCEGMTGFMLSQKCVFLKRLTLKDG